MVTASSARVHALLWGLFADALAELAEQLFRAGCAEAALDVIGAAIALHGEPQFHRACVAYRRALGRELAAAAPTAAVPAPARPPLDDRAEALLHQIRADPDDDAPHLVFADQVADAFPEHAALILAQCGPAHAGAAALEEAFRRTLPAWLDEV